MRGMLGSARLTYVARNIARLVAISNGCESGTNAVTNATAMVTATHAIARQSLPPERSSTDGRRRTRAGCAEGAAAQNRMTGGANNQRRADAVGSLNGPPGPGSDHDLVHSPASHR